MTTTVRPGAPTDAAPRQAVEVSTTMRTMRAYLACCLGILPLCALFTDRGWLLDVWLAMLVAVGPAALLRLRWPARVSQVWLGIVLLGVYATLRYASRYALLGFIPGPGAWHDFGLYLSSLHDTISNSAAPVGATQATTLALSVLLGLLAALVDLLAVVDRRGALAGIPLLIVFTVAGAVPRAPVHVVWFLCAAIAFLILLSLDAEDMVREWGRLIPRPGATRTRTMLSVSAQRIAIIALATAVLVPLAAPTRGHNLIADLFHNGNSTDGGNGDGGSGVSIDPFAGLKGQLIQHTPRPVFNVTLSGSSDQAPFYLRTTVLSTYTARGWTQAGPGPLQDVQSALFGDDIGNTLVGSSDNFTADITVSGLGGAPPLFARPVSITGLPDGAQWSAQDALVTGAPVHRGEHFTEDVAQPNVSIDELNQVGTQLPAGTQPYLLVPNDLPNQVRVLVGQITESSPTLAEKALAVQRFFTTPVNGFTYSLSTKAGDSGSDLVDFLSNRQGFCQQYAGAMAIMLRVAGVPARVVLGYTHPSGTSFTVMTNEAHAWVEAYFPNTGWLAFDPTPNGGAQGGGGKSTLPWVPQPTTSATSAPSSNSLGSSVLAHQTHQTSTAGGAGSNAANGHQTRLSARSMVLAAGFLVALAIALVPAAVRLGRRRSRLRRARSGAPDQLWEELSATAVDLGYVWSPARTPRQITHWLESQAGAGVPVGELAAAVEQSRYAAPSTATLVASAQLRRDLHAAESLLRRNRTLRTRLAARLLPGSLGWRLPVLARRR
jgi:transglutaminase-like putative cysteine protease